LMVDWFPPLFWWWNLIWLENLVLLHNFFLNLAIWTHFLFRGEWVLCSLTLTIAIYLGRERWNIYGCLNFISSYCICNWN
jgi:hypothetical protein